MRDLERDRRRRFEQLLASHGRDVVSYCRWRAASPSDAEDALADVFLVVWRRIDRVPDGAAGRAWLYATARRVLANQRRSSRRRVALSERLITVRAADVVAGEESDERDARVHDALRQLNAHDREVLLLVEWEGLSLAELASVLDCLAVTARGRLHRARRRFRDAYERAGSADHDPKECQQRV